MSFISENANAEETDDNADDEKGMFTGNDRAIIKLICKLDLEIESLRFKVTHPRTLRQQIESNIYPQQSRAAVSKK